eukprot:c24365_g5_i1 orf=436-609(+)
MRATSSMHQCVTSKMLRIYYRNMSNLELLTTKGLTETPIMGGNIIGGESAAVACGDL